MKENKSIKKHEHHKHPKCGEGSLLGRVMTGILLIGAGVLLVAWKMDFITDTIADIIFSWQSLLIGLGIIMLANRKGAFPGVILLVVGGIFMLPKVMDNFPYDTGNLVWGAVFIIVGLMVLFGGKRWKKHAHKGFSKKGADTKDFIEETHVFSGGDKKIYSDNFKGGKISAVFGGGTYDLTNVTLSDEGTNVLEVSFVFGGIELIIPADWTVTNEVSTVFGGFSEKKNKYVNVHPDPAKVLIITGSAVFGGGEIKRA